MATFANAFQPLIDAAVARQGEKVAQLLKLDNPILLQAVKIHVSANGNLPDGMLKALHSPRMVTRIPSEFQADWTSILVNHAECLAAVLARKMDVAFSHLAECTSRINHVFKWDPEPWTVHFVVSSAESLRVVAFKADEQLVAQRKQRCKQEEAGSYLQKLLATALGGVKSKDVTSRGKLMASLPLMITMFRLYFKLNTLRNCKALLTNMALPSFPSLDRFPKAHCVTLKFYTGRLAIFSDQLADAEGDLQFAFQHSLASAIHNRRLCLFFLVPIRLLCGSLPSEAFLSTHGLQIYIPFVQAMKSGSPRQFDTALETHQQDLIRQGVYLMMVRLKPLVLRRLFKRCWVIHKEGNERGHQFPLSLLHKALSWQQMDMDVDAVECAVANLIHKKYVKGYISHKSQTVVLSKADPFPQISAQQLGQYR